VDCLQQKRKKTAVAPFLENDERNNEESSIEPIGVRLTVQEKFLCKLCIIDIGTLNFFTL
jgi:hypothetical protein